MFIVHNKDAIKSRLSVELGGVATTVNRIPRVILKMAEKRQHSI